MTANEDARPRFAPPAQEQDWLRAAQRGDRRAFTCLIEHYKQPVYYLALSLVGNHEDASDCAQGAFERAWRAIARFELGRPFQPWVFRITRNLCYTLLEKRNRRRKMVSLSVEDGQLDIPDEKQDPRRAVAQGEREKIVREGLERLRPNDREIIVLCDLEGMAYREIADTLGIPIGTVMSRLFNARQRLKKLLEPLLFEAGAPSRPKSEGPDE